MPDTLLGAGELDMDERNKVPALKKKIFFNQKKTNNKQETKKNIFRW